MDSFWIHQALSKNSQHVEQLNEHLSDLKALTNGHLAKEASDSLKTISERLATDIEGLGATVTGLCVDLKDTQASLGAVVSELKNALIWIWIMLGATSLLLCYLAYRAR